jgi:hypothetical protein
MMRGVTRMRMIVASAVCCLVAQAAPAQESLARLMGSLTAITAGNDGAARRDAIVAQLRALRVEPSVEPFGQGQNAGANVVVSLPGGAGKTIVVGAHLDRVSVGRGAVDNGASCAALIELVAAFRASPLTRATLQVVFFDREETGLEGSRAYFAAPGRRRAEYALNLDIFAYGDTIFATASKSDGVLLRSLRAAGEAVGLPVRDVPRNRYPTSDHVSMMNAGIETLGLALIDAADVDGVLAMGQKPGNAVPRILTIIHTPNDTLNDVRPGQMARGIELVDRLIRMVDREAP